MGSYFLQTINTIHTKLDVMAAGLPDACCDSDKLPETKLESFTPLNMEEVIESLLKALLRKHVCLIQCQHP